jgi:hypothetical protein
MCGIVVKLLTDQGYSEEQMDRLCMLDLICFDWSRMELPDDMVKYRDYVIRRTMERHDRINNPS